MDFDAVDNDESAIARLPVHRVWIFEGYSGDRAAVHLKTMPGGDITDFRLILRDPVFVRLSKGLKDLIIVRSSRVPPRVAEQIPGGLLADGDACWVAYDSPLCSTVICRHFALYRRSGDEAQR